MKAQIAQQKSIVEQYELICGEEREEKTVGEVKERIAALHAQYRRIDCELLNRDVEIAAIDYDYDAAILSATRTLVESNIKTKFELVIEEYDLSQSKERVDGYRSRAKACRKRLKDRPKH
jgi:DNA-binding LacI/PurR family transcriptional regulator